MTTKKQKSISQETESTLVLNLKYQLDQWISLNKQKQQFLYEEIKNLQDRIDKIEKIINPTPVSTLPQYMKEPEVIVSPDKFEITNNHIILIILIGIGLILSSMFYYLHVENMKQLEIINAQVIE